MPWLTLLRLIGAVTGFTLCAALLIALRTLAPYTGSGPEVAAALLGITLAAFAWGLSHHASGPRRRTLLRRLLLALLLLAPGLSMMLVEALFFFMRGFGAVQPLQMAAAYAALLLAPAYWALGGVTRLLSSYRGVQLAPAIASGAALSAPLLLLLIMPYAGLHFGVVAVAVALTLSLTLLNRTHTARTLALPVLMLLLCIGINASALFRSFGIVEQNAHNIIRVVSQGADAKLMRVNNAPAAYLNEKSGERLKQTELAERTLLPASSLQPRQVLVIGAGGFTFGLNDTSNRFTYVDADPGMKKAAEEYFLGRKLGDNKTFVPEPARSFLRQAGKAAYDVIYVDVANGRPWLPEDLSSQEFFDELRQALKPDGVIGLSVVFNPVFSDDYSLSVNKTFRSVFPASLNLPVTEIQSWEQRDDYYTSAIYIGYNRPLSERGVIYTDDRSPLLWHKNPSVSY